MMKSLYVISTGTMFFLGSWWQKKNHLNKPLNKNFSGQPVELFSEILSYSIKLDKTEQELELLFKTNNDGYKTLLSF